MTIISNSDKIEVTFQRLLLFLFSLKGKQYYMKIIYSRQSLDKKDSISIESQIDHCKGQILPNDTEMVKVIQDKGYSGKNTQRPGFEEMMGYINSGVVSQVIVYKLDRISRSLLDFAEMMNIFNKHNVNFISATEKFDTSTPTGRAMISIIMVFAQLERETIQQRITDNYYSRGKIGMSLGGTTPYGYTKIKTILNGKSTSMFQEDPKTINTLIKIFNEYAYTDKSLGKIASTLNSEGILSPKGAPWDNSKISRILRNPTYVKADADIYHYYKAKGCIIENEIDNYIGVNACYLYGKRSSNERKYTDVSEHKLSLAPHEGAIDSHTFILCQHKLDNNKQIKRSGAGKSTWLSGLMKCAYCGYAMNITLAYVSKEKGEMRRIVCGGRKLPIPCQREILSYDLISIETYVESELKNIIKRTKDMNGDTSSLFLQKQSQEENAYKIEIEKIDSEINNLINGIALGNDIAMKYFNERIKKLDSRKVDLINKINELKSNQIQDDKLIEISLLADKWDTLDIESKKKIAKYFIKGIIFYNNEIKIDWRLYD